MRGNVLSYNKKSSHHVGESGFQTRENCAWGIRNSGLWNPEYSSKNPESQQILEPRIQFHRQRLEASTWNLESTVWNPESKTVLDSFSSGERVISKIWFPCCFSKELLASKIFLCWRCREKTKFFDFSKKSRNSRYWDRKSPIYTSSLKHLTSSIIRKSENLRAVWESKIISASSHSLSATQPPPPPGVATFAN